jgi:hypothetical protein
MRFVFTIKTKSGAILNIGVDAPDQAEAEKKVARENPTCTITKIQKT